MPARTDTFDLRGLHLSSGAGRRLELDVAIEPFTLAGERYRVEPQPVAVKLDVSRTTGEGYALLLRFEASLVGPCMRCLEPAAPVFDVESREVSQPASAPELRSPYLKEELLDLHAWARDALALSSPAQVLCRSDCAGLCPECGANLNHSDAHHHERAQPDQRWAKLSELRFE